MPFTCNFRKMVAVNHDKGSGMVFFKGCLSIVFNNVLLCQGSNMFQSTFQSLTTLGSKGDAVVRALASHHWAGFESWRRRHMWVDFVVGSLPCFERFFSVYSGFPLSLKTNASKNQFDLERTDTFSRVLKNS